jgi:hypothetical protein
MGAALVLLLGHASSCIYRLNVAMHLAVCLRQKRLIRIVRTAAGVRFVAGRK